MRLNLTGRHLDIYLHARGEKFLHAAGKAGDWDASLTNAIQKLNHQALKVKGNL